MMHIKEYTDLDEPVSGAMLPRHLLLLSTALALLVPFTARLVGVPAHGWEWFADYASDAKAVLFFSAFNLAPAAALYVAGKASRHAPLGYWFAVAAYIAFALWAHGTVDLRSSSTAGIALLFIPIYAAVVTVMGWGIGLLFHVIVRKERMRDVLAPAVLVLAVAAGSLASVTESMFVKQRESRLPVVSVQDIALAKHRTSPS